MKQKHFIYNENLSNFTKRVAILDNSILNSLLDKCKAFYDTIDQSNESLENFKNLTKTKFHLKLKID